MQTNNLIIDGTNLEFRIFFVSKNNKQINAAGEQVGCIFRFLLTFKNLVEQFDPDEIYIVWDRKLTWPSRNFRQELLEDQYKAGREKPVDVQEMYDQEVKLIEMLQALGAKNMFPNVLEADDIAAWLSKTLQGTSVVVSVDRDLLQLVDHRTSVYNLKKLITEANFEDEVGVPLSMFKLCKAISGDSGDSIPGLPGYGMTRAKKLASKWNTASVSDEFKQIVERNLKLIDLDYGYANQPGEEAVYSDQYNKQKGSVHNIARFRELCTQYEFIPYLSNFREWEHLVKRNTLVNLINTLK